MADIVSMFLDKIGLITLSGIRLFSSLNNLSKKHPVNTNGLV